MYRMIRFVMQVLLSGVGAIVLLTLLTAGVCAAFRRGFTSDQLEQEESEAALC
jgi:hypothetical protein